MEQIKIQIRSYILESLWAAQDGLLCDDDSFMELGILDSLGLLQLVSFVEEKYGIEVGHLSPDNLDSISRIAAFVKRKLAARESSTTAYELESVI